MTPFLKSLAMKVPVFRAHKIRVDALLGPLLVFASLGAGAPQEKAPDFSCATFHAFLNESELIAKFGAGNVTSGPVFGSDDGPSEGTILFEERDDMRVEIMWHDVARKEYPAWIRVRGERSQWRTPNGLAIGDDLLSIERRNGWPFRLAGFSSEGGHGRLRDWRTGRLGNMLNCDIRPAFQPRPGTEEPSLIRQVTSLTEVSSGHPAMQKINPHVVELWINHPLPPSPRNPADAILDVQVFGLHMPINPALYDTELRAEVMRYLRRASAYIPKRAPSSPGLEMFYRAQISYETRLVANSDDPRAPALAETYVTLLRPCYEWEGFHDCPEAEARFAEDYQAANPKGPFSEYLPLLAAHRRLCAAEAYDYEKKPDEAGRSRRSYEQRLEVARQSKILLIRTAAERLASRGQCIASTRGCKRWPFSERNNGPAIKRASPCSKARSPDPPPAVGRPERFPPALRSCWRPPGCCRRGHRRGRGG